MHRRFATALLALLLTGACVGGGTDPAQPQPAPGQNGGGDEQSQAPDGDAVDPAEDGEISAEPNESEDSGTVTANPAATLEGKCTREPQAGPDGEELVAELDLVNTGNIGVAVRVSCQWPTGKRDGITRWIRVRVEPGETLPVTVRLPIATETADEIRKALEKGQRPRKRQRITGAFGVPQ